MSAISTHGQHPGFSKLFHYSEDTSVGPDLINTLIFDSTNEKLYFHVSGFRTPDYGTPAIFYRTDLQGNVEKEVLDTLTGGHIVYHALAPSRDGAHLYWGGTCFSPAESQTVFWVLTKTDKELNLIWRRLYPTNAMNGYTQAIRTHETKDDITLLCDKATEANNSLGLPELPNRIYIRELDSAGNVLNEYTPGPANWNNPTDMVVTDDGGSLVCGITYSWGEDGTAFSLKADAGGNENWHQFYYQEMETGYPLRIEKCKDTPESYLIVGEALRVGTDVGLAFVSKVNSTGVESWKKILSIDPELTSFKSSITNDPRGGYVAAGTTRIDKNLEARLGWLTRFDNNGNEIWRRTVTAFPRNTDHEYLYRIISLPDGGFVAAGSSFGKNINGRWNQEGWLVRVDSNGCMNPECSGDVLSVEGVHKSLNTVRLFPNPARDKVFLESTETFPVATTVRIMDNLGRIIQQKNAPISQKRMQLSLSSIPPGIYYLQVENPKSVFRQKLTILK